MNIYDYLKTYSDDLVYYCPNPGNGGDAIIAYSTYQIFNELGIKYKIARLGDNLKNKIVSFLRKIQKIPFRIKNYFKSRKVEYAT